LRTVIERSLEESAEASGTIRDSHRAQAVPEQCLVAGDDGAAELVLHPREHRREADARAAHQQGVGSAAVQILGKLHPHSRVHAPLLDRSFAGQARRRSDVFGCRALFSSGAADARIRLDGPSSLTRAFPSWNARSMFAHIEPDPSVATRH
jgi:hypothetical protein